MAGVLLDQSPALKGDARSPLALGQIAAKMRQSDDQLWTLNAEALSSVQKAFNALQMALKQTTGNDISQVFVTAPDGKILGWIGANGPTAAGGFYIGYLSESPKAIVGITNATPPVANVVAHGYTTGDTVAITNDSVAAYNRSWIITVTDPNHYSLNGGVASGVGSGGQSTRFFAGVWAQTAAFAGTGFADAKIKCQADGSVIITGARIELDGSAATIILDPVVGDITVTNTAGTLQTVIDSVGVTVQFLPAGAVHKTIIQPGLIDVINGFGSLAVMIWDGGVNSLPGYQVNSVTVIDSAQNATFHQLTIGTFGLLVNSTGDINVKSLTIDSSTHLISNSGDMNMNSYSSGGTPGITISGGFEITGFSSTTLTAGSDAGTVVVTGITTRSQAFKTGLRV